MQITPGETGKLPYHSAIGTTGLYVQAKLYDSSTLLTTLNLTEVSGGYYTVNYTPDGTHKHIFAQLIPYTDSGHTIKTEGDLETSIDIYVEYPYRMQMGSSGGSINIDYKLLAKEIWEYKIDDDEKAKDILLKKSEFNSNTDLVKTDLKIEKPVFNTRILQDLITEKIDKIENKINNIKIPIQQSAVIDLKPILNEIKKIDNKSNLDTTLFAISKLEKKIDNLPQEKVDFSFLKDELNNIKEGISQDNALIMIDNLEEKIKELIQEVNLIKKENKDETILKNLDILKTIKNLIIENQEMLEMFNQVDNERVKEILKVLEKLNNLVSLKKELVYVEQED